MGKSEEELYKGNEGWEEFSQTQIWKKALEFAKKKHEGQFRDEGVPYFEHIKGVMEILINETNTYDDIVLTIAALHDVLEDTDCTYEELEKIFGSNIAGSVNLLTRKEGQSFDEYAKNIFENEDYPYVRKVKLADRLHNLRCLPKTNNSQKIIKKVKETERCIIPYEERCPRELMKRIKDEILELKKMPEFNNQIR